MASKTSQQVIDLADKVLIELGTGPKNTKELADKLTPVFRNKIDHALLYLERRKNIERAGIVRVCTKYNPGRTTNRATLWRLKSNGSKAG